MFYFPMSPSRIKSRNRTQLLQLFSWKEGIFMIGLKNEEAWIKVDNKGK
jgi:hypothetical protein